MRQDVIAEQIPAALRARDQWVVWAEIEREGKRTKVPGTPDGRRPASSTDPSTWGAFATALATYLREPERWQGIGYVFSGEDGTIGIDMDHCRDPESGQLTDQAADLVAHCRSYAEVSPSGTGVHIFLRGQLPAGAKHRAGAVEIYDRGRYFTVTGQHLTETPHSIEPRQAMLNALLAALHLTNGAPPLPVNGHRHQHQPPSGFSGDDEALIAAAGRGVNGAAFVDLWAGDWGERYDSHSQADLALCNTLAWWCGPDVERIDRLFRRSGLMRAKWDERRGQQTYGQITIETALTDRHEWYQETGGTAEAGTPRSAGLTAAQAQRAPRFPLTDLGNGERFAHRHGADLRYCSPWHQWLVWDGQRWAPDVSQTVNRLARETLRALYTEAATASAQAAAIEAEHRRLAQARHAEALLAHAKRSEALPRTSAMMQAAQMDCQIQPDVLDADPWMLTVQNGTLDLRTGTLSPHTREPYRTKITQVPYDPHARCPAWEAFLETILAGKQELIAFVQEALGYSLTGETSEQCFFLLYGSGANGKSTFLDVVSALLGEYAEHAEFSTFLVQRGEAVRNDLARLRGARLVTAAEADEGKRLSESLVKSLTGGELITTRFLHQEYFSFRPQFKLWLATNHKPVIHGTDHALWRRVRLIPFTVTIPDHAQDKTLAATLKEELPGILAWALRGCLTWQQEGCLTAPEAVQGATAEYRAEMDVLGSFLLESCECAEPYWIPATELYTVYNRWCEQAGEKALTQTAFGARLRERGFVPGRSSVTGRKLWQGLRVRIVGNPE